MYWGLSGPPTYKVYMNPWYWREVPSLPQLDQIVALRDKLEQASCSPPHSFAHPFE